jgi:methylenetetrahydrofolate reductase (NADPH)
VSDPVKISELLARGPSFSFEFFPPRDEEAEAVLVAALEELEPLAPTFVSVTYGAGGSTRERTQELVVQIMRETTMVSMAHLTCVGHSRAELTDIVTRYGEAGIENILALGGDPPPDSNLPPAELHHAVELVELVRDVGDFCVGVAAHPEPHPRSSSKDEDRLHTAEKLRAADFAITQFFFDAGHYFDLVESLAAHGVDKPVIPGIMPVLSLAGIQRMSQLQGSALPAWLIAKLEAVGDDPKAVRRVGVEEATKLGQTLLEGGAPGLHFYTLNRSRATREIFAGLGLAG